MKKLFIPLLLLLSSCSGQLDPTKEWRVSYKNKYSQDMLRICICSIKITDGNNCEVFDDSCCKYTVGEIIPHRVLRDTAKKDSSLIQKAYKIN